MQLVTILESHNVTDLLIPKSMLEDAGIPCFMKNELSTQVLNYMATMTVELQVARKDLEAALKILSDYEN